MATVVQFLPIVLGQQFGRQQLERMPEPDGLTDAVENVTQYDRVMTTKLAIAYAVGLEMVHRTYASPGPGSALDLACGPGHFTLLLARYLHFQNIIGVDLAPRMVRAATNNAQTEGLAVRVHFRLGDVTGLHDIESDTMELTSFTDASHHMPDLATVGQVLGEMERITRPEGLIMVMDLVRLRTRNVTEKYVRLMGHDYIDRGLPQFFDDFRNSMYAAWTPAELQSAVPRDTDRYWYQIVPRGLPTIQFLFGLPAGRKRLFVRSGLPWARDNHPLDRGLRGEWRMLRGSLQWAAAHIVSPAVAR